MKATTLDEIKEETSERKLHSIAWLCHGNMKSGQISAEHYRDCMMALTEKLGFAPLEENLKTAADFEL